MLQPLILEFMTQRWPPMMAPRQAWERLHEVVIVGMGHLGRSIAAYLANRLPKLRLSAAFDVNPDKIGATFSGVPCFAVDTVAEIVTTRHVILGILTVPAEHAQTAAEALVRAGVKGIFNFAPACLHLPAKIHVETIST